MNIGEIADKFILAAEMERARHELVGPAALRGAAAALCPHLHR
jgi:hypothetical protein